MPGTGSGQHAPPDGLPDLAVIAVLGAGAALLHARLDPLQGTAEPP